MEYDLEKDIEEESKKKPLRRFCSIYRVPDKIRKLNEDAYTPHVVSIGPFHHGKKEFNFMERQKMRYLVRFRERKLIGLSELFGVIKNFEDIIRGFYSETFDDLSSEKFVRIVIVDAIFVLELLFLSMPSSSSLSSDVEDEIFTHHLWVLDGVSRDLILLENQLPYFILEMLYGKIYAPNIAQEGQDSSFFKLVCSFFAEHSNTAVKEYSNSPVTSTQDFKHLTDVIRSFYKPSIQICPPCRSVNIHSASKLHEAGVKFKKLEPGRTLFDIHVKFSGGVLQMARFQVVEKTESLLRNLMALEQWLYPSDAYICQYVSLLDHLIDTIHDVDLLVKADILSHRLGTTDAVVSLVNQLCKNIETSY